MAAHRAGVEAGQQFEGLLKFVECCLVELGLAQPVKNFLVRGIHADVKLSGQWIELLDDLGQAAVGHEEGGDSVLVADVEEFT